MRPQRRRAASTIAASVVLVGNVRLGRPDIRHPTAVHYAVSSAARGCFTASTWRLLVQSAKPWHGRCPILRQETDRRLLLAILSFRSMPTSVGTARLRVN